MCVACKAKRTHFDLSLKLQSFLLFHMHTSDFCTELQKFSESYSRGKKAIVVEISFSKSAQ